MLVRRFENLHPTMPCLYRCSDRVQVERILSATNEIEKMLNPMKYRSGMLFKHDKTFKQEVAEIKSNINK